MPGAQTFSSPRASTPFDALPDFVISDIFVLVWCSHDFHKIRRDIHKMRIPYNLASVSRRWREVALSTSRIWTFVNLSLRPEHLAAHLARSKHLPIDVGLILDKKYSQVNLRELLHILKETNIWARMSDLGALLDHRYMDVFVNAFNSAIDDNSASVLQSIRIEPPSDSDQLEGRMLPLAWTDLRIPQSQILRSIYLDHVRLSPIQELPSCPLPGLQRLEFKGIDLSLPNSLLPFLCLTPNLTYLAFGRCLLQALSDTTVAPRPRHSILLAELDTLTLSDAGLQVGLNLLFRMLDMPKLRSVSFCTHDAVFDGLALIGMPSPHPYTFSSRPGRTSSEALAGLLSRINQLRQLSALLLFDCELPTPDEFVGRLARRLLETSCCPSIVTLGIYFPLGDESREFVKELKRTRPSMSICSI
ncbi:hypothetical protein FRC12_018557 [Ceratobasidium sp. 428]|nr:hypothetical protein FRC12_018557 [Ceratobasidium sp. 428]